MPDGGRSRSTVVSCVDADQQLRLLVGRAAGAQAMFDRELRCIAASPRWMSDYAVSGDPAIGLPIDRLSPSLPPRWREAYLRGLDGDVVVRDRDIVRADATDERWVSWSVCPWREADGRVGGITVSISEAAVSRDAGQSAAAGRELEALFATPAVGVAVLDGDGRILSSNEAFRAIVGATAEGTEGMCIGSVVHRDDLHAVDQAIASIRSGLRPEMPQRIRFARLDGGEASVRQWMEALPDDGSSRGRILVVASDISEIAVMERMVRDAERISTLGLGGAALGHDLASALIPLRAFVGALETIAGQHPADVRQQGHLDGLRRTTDYIQGLAEASLGARAAIDPDHDGSRPCTDLHGWWGRSADFLRRVLPPGIELSFVIGPGVERVGLPPQDLSQLFLNLVSNAGRAIGARAMVAGEPATVAMRADAWRGPGGPCVRIVVVDDGIGMTADQRRVAAGILDGTGHDGAGLGLTIVRRIVSGVGGHVSLTSVVGEGTAVEVLLPVAGMQRPGGP
jgi:PAS domain S-box-containing protein